MIQDTVFCVRELPGTYQSEPPQFRARRTMKSLQTTRTYADIHILFSTWRYFPNEVNTWNGICSVSSRREIRASNLPKDPKIHEVKGKSNLNFTKLRTQNRYWVRSFVNLYCKNSKEDLSNEQATYHHRIHSNRSIAKQVSDFYIREHVFPIGMYWYVYRTMSNSPRAVSVTLRND